MISDIWIESLRATVVLFLLYQLWQMGRKERLNVLKGWQSVLAGFGLILFASLLDISDNFPALNHFVVIGDTTAESFLEKVVGYLGGFIALALGFTQWVPLVARLRATEDQLACSRANYARLYQSMRDAYAMVDMTGCLVDFNPAFRDMLGYADEELRRLAYSDITPEKWHDFESRIIVEQILPHGSSQVYEKEYRRKNGTHFPVELRTFLLRDKDGQPEAMWTIARDITDRKQDEAEKEKLQQQLIQSQKMEVLGRLAGGVAHDFNNMLTVIMGYTEMLINNSQENDLQALTAIADAATRSKNLTMQLLTFSRKQVISPKSLNLNTVIFESQKMLCRVMREDIKLTLHLAEDLGHVFLDSSQIDQILLNLAVNAKDAMIDGGELEIATENVFLGEDDCQANPGATPGAYVQLTVRDNGLGMNKETLDHLFEPFFTTKGLGKGTGLGLATVYGIVKQNNGCIEVESEPGRGTTFKISFPQHSSNEEGSSVSDSDNVLVPGGSGSILLVEDDNMVRELLASTLTMLGYTVTPTATAEEALEACTEGTARFDLLITDIILPGMDGKDLGKRLESEKPDIKVLYISGYTAEIIASKGVLQDRMNFLQKPFTMTEVAHKVKEVFAADK